MPRKQQLLILTTFSGAESARTLMDMAVRAKIAKGPRCRGTGAAGTSGHC
ncbi:MAG: hypothetical protein H6618_09075 [Deltaproteobacteria bacterium]|nr:hypothetical protein [Deltaproteobacteria bacterium]